MLIIKNGSAYAPLSIRDPETGNSVNADVITAYVYREGQNTPIFDSVNDPGVVIIIGFATGQYTVQVVTTNAAFVIGNQYIVRVRATVGLITDETQVLTFQVSAASHGLAIDTTISSRATNAGVWAETFYGQAASEILCFAGIGAGAGVVDTGEPFDTGNERTETFKYFDGTNAFIVTADKYGNRQTVDLSP